MVAVSTRLIAAFFSLVLLLVMAISSFGFSQKQFDRPTDRPSEALPRFGRRLLAQGGKPAAPAAAAAANATARKKPARMGEGCSPDDIILVQAATTPLPNGIPTYTVHVLNECLGGGECNIGHIHLSCGLFSSARLVNPKVFRRLRPDDCLVNNGSPIGSGQSVSFQYANTFSYSLSVSSAVCLTTT